MAAKLNKSKAIVILIVILLVSSVSLYGYSQIKNSRVSTLSEIENSILEAIVPTEQSVVEEKITLDRIFDGIDAGYDSEDTWSILVGGDVMIGRTVNYKTIGYKDFSWPYKNLSDAFGKSDFVYVNLESPVIENCPIKNEGMIFCGDTKHIEAMSKSGIDAVSLANNHMLNQGKAGLETTINSLIENNITAVGVANPTYQDIKGNKIALLAYTDVECYEGVACVDYEQIKKDISIAKENSELIIIMYHWGAEYRDYPTDRQIEIAHLSIDAGADLVLGNHPHWIQPFEVYKDKLIMYSHGNLVFDQMWSQKTKEGVLVEYTFQKNRLIDAQIYPIQIEDYGQPFFLDEDRKNKKIEFINQISQNLSTGQR